MTFHKSIYADIVGVFGGYQPAQADRTYMVPPDSQFKAKWVYHEVGLFSAKQPGVKSRYFIVRRIGRVHETRPGDSQPEISTHQYLNVEVPPPRNSESKLEIVVDKGRLTRVLWNGVEVPDLNDDNCYFREPPPSASGKLGVINEIRATTFKEARFKVTRQ